jgi:hypothetical protein
MAPMVAGWTGSLVSDEVAVGSAAARLYTVEVNPKGVVYCGRTCRGGVDGNGFDGD